MTIEERLKYLILAHYKSLNAFASAAGVPYTTIVSILERGLLNARIGTIIKICKCLGISADSLGDGEIVARDTSGLNLNTHEVESIRKYRALDERGKRAVDETLEREYGYTKPFEQDSSNAIGAG